VWRFLYTDKLCFYPVQFQTASAAQLLLTRNTVQANWHHRDCIIMSHLGDSTTANDRPSHMPQAWGAFSNASLITQTFQKRQSFLLDPTPPAK
jgi:hypothetical protein